jgi:hypothetical protein
VGFQAMASLANSNPCQYGWAFKVRSTTLLSIFVHQCILVGPIDLETSAFERELNSTQNANGYILAGLFSAVEIC